MIYSREKNYTYGGIQKKKIKHGGQRRVQFRLSATNDGKDKKNYL